MAQREAEENKSVNGSHGNALAQAVVRNPYVTIVHCGDDEVVVKHGSRSKFTKNVRDEGRTKLLGRILRNVHSPASLSELHQQGVLKENELEDSANLVEYLRGEGVLIGAQEDVTRVYLRSVFGQDSPLAERTVGLVGVGYLGSRIACQLSQMGVGTLIALDDRKVQKPELEKRYFDLLPGALEEGTAYTEVLGQHLDALGFGTYEGLDADFTDEKALDDLLRRCDFVVVCLEVFSPSTLHRVNSVAIEAEKPWASVYIDGSEAMVGPIYVPGESCCYNEFEIQQEATLGSMKDDYLVFKESLNGHEVNSSQFVLPPYLSTASGIAAMGILRFLLSGRSFLVGRTNRVDFERLSIDFEEVLRLPRCPACGPNRPGYRNLFM
ncbi:MAG: TOMM precursor leader peptide-binding protein [Acidobacteriota bacterium]|nr:TOMM precursor leader peptide-binding protein [Acidobacteriota bacterium]